MTEKAPYTNALIHETSPYLLQHAHNPVDWMPWGDEALKKAKAENKPIIVSIGYAACHWCHVMEHESFENEEVAYLMNKYFVCIKVDREERPDIDQLYMSAVQLLSGQGGWPLNMVALPDGRPFWGGTYFQKPSWMSILKQIHELYTTDPGKVVEYAKNLSEGMKQTAMLKHENHALNALNDVLKAGVNNWKQHFDLEHGGNNRAPKFMMPNNLRFLMHYGHQNVDKDVLYHVQLTLLKMARGGVYDQIGGGFARYSVDEIWKVPHFEKMLYDNAQLVSLYAMAYQKFKDPEFKKVVYQTIQFVKREMLSTEGFFYASLDADSEGEEGKFYVWQKNELKDLLKDEFELFSAYYNVNSTGYWEDGNFILLRTSSDETFARQHQISLKELTQKVEMWNRTLLKQRNNRIRPGLDDKILTSWNAMMAVGLLQAYFAFGEAAFLDLALKNANALVTKILGHNGELWHSYKNGEKKIPGFLEDYAHVMQLFSTLFQYTGEEKWFDLAQKIQAYTNKNFWDNQQGSYTFNNREEEVLITHQYEVYDNVIPASNSVMANALFVLGKISGDTNLIERAQEMLQQQMVVFEEQFSGLSNWGILAMCLENPFYEVAVVGEESTKIEEEIRQNFLPGVLLVFSKSANSSISLLQNRYVTGQTLIYVCQNNSCKLPVNTWELALKTLENKK